MADSGFTETSRRLGAASIDLLSDHAELFTLELQEQKQNSARQFLFLSLGVACGFMFLLMLSALLVVLFWQPYQHFLLLAMAVFYGALVGLCIWRVKKLQRESEAPFSATLTELKKTKEQILP